jgi:hypothetical protein
MATRLRVHSRKMAYGVRQYGVRYLLNAPANELRNPRLEVTRLIRAAAIAVGDAFRRRPNESPVPEDCLLFVYDLGASPITFDFATFLAGAELERRRHGLNGIYVLFIPGPHDGLRRELPSYEATMSPERRHWRVRHMLLPLTAFLPSVHGYTVCATRAQANPWIGGGPMVPQDFRVWLPRQPDKRLAHTGANGGRFWPMLRATGHGRTIVEGFLESVCDGRLPVVVTIRDSATSPVRNSHIDEWRAFLDSLDRRRFVPILVHDAEAPLGPVPAALAGEIFCEAARWNLEARMALYEAAWLNLAVMHGPMELCWYNERARYVLFLDPGADASSEAEIVEGGLEIGRDLTFATPFQHIVWQTDRAAVIREAFDAMAARIERDATESARPR